MNIIIQTADGLVASRNVTTGPWAQFGGGRGGRDPLTFLDGGT